MRILKLLLHGFLMKIKYIQIAILWPALVITLLFLNGCAVLSATAGAAISITGAVVSTGIKVTGAVIEAGVNAVSSDDPPDK
jgi:hypothetical protein